MFAITDLETTGLNPWRNEILTLCTIVVDENLKEIDRVTLNRRPEFLGFWSEEAEKVHKISIDETNDFDDSKTFISKYIKFLRNISPDGGYSFVCHAFPFKNKVDLFDFNFVFSLFWQHDRRASFYNLFPEKKLRSTITRNKKDALDNWGVENQKLDTWMDFLNIEKTNHHNAEFDSEVCLEVLKYQLKAEKNDKDYDFYNKQKPKDITHSGDAFKLI